MGTRPPNYDEFVTNSLQMVQSAKANYDTLRTAQAAQSGLLAQKDALEAKVRGQQKLLQEVSRIEETYDKDYLDRKRAGPRTSAFGKIGMANTQDWAIFLYFLSYGLFSAAILVYATYLSTRKIATFLFFGILMLIFGLFSLLMIRYYG